jgi:hypothetical protein
MTATPESVLDQRARCVERSRHGTCPDCITATEPGQPCDCCCPVCVAAQPGTCQAGQLGHAECQHPPECHVIRGRTGQERYGEWRLCGTHALPYRDQSRCRVIPLAVSGAMSCKTCGANLTDGSGDGTNGHWQNCTTPYGHGKAPS